MNRVLLLIKRSLESCRLTNSFNYCYIVLYFLWINPTLANDTVLTEQWLLPSVNLQSPLQSPILCLRNSQGQLFIATRDWQKLTLKSPSLTPITHKNLAYYPVDSVSGLSYKIDDINATVAFMADVSFFARNVKDLSAISALPPNAPKTLGVYVNYDFLTRQINDVFSHQASIETVAFSSLGILENQLLVRDLAQQQTDTLRLNTSFTHHKSQQLYTVKIGDSISKDIGLGANVRFAGVQFGTNFALQPNKITVPQPSIAGASAIASSADVFINNVKRATQKLPVGSFAIQNLPVVTGQGEAKVVVTDILGQQQEIIVPYYVSPESLRAGLNEYAVQMGVIRQNYGIDSQNYGQAFASMTHRHGISDTFTIELEGQLSRHQQMLSYGTVVTHPVLGAIHAVGAASHHDDKQGSALSVAMTHQRPVFNVGANVVVQSRDYVNLDAFNRLQPLHYTGQFFANMPLGQRGSLSTSYTYQKPFDAVKFSFVQASYSANLGRWGTFAASLTHTMDDDKDTLTQINYSLPLGHSNHAQLTVYPQQDKERLSVQRHLQTGQDWGYVLAAEHGQSNKQEAALLWQNNIGRFSVKTEHQHHQTANEARVSGSVAFLEGQTFLGKRIDKGFAVVEVPEFNNVRVYHDNRLMGKTNHKGTLMIPQLRAYQSNTLRLAIEDLPLNAQIQSATVEVIPTLRGGMYVKFPVKKSHSATLTLLQNNGQPVPTGASVQSTVNQELFPVGLLGKVYLTDLSTTPQTFEVQWGNQRCSISVALKTLNQTQPHLGTYTCATQTEATP